MSSVWLSAERIRRQHDCVGAAVPDIASALFRRQRLFLEEYIEIACAVHDAEDLHHLIAHAMNDHVIAVHGDPYTFAPLC